MSTATRVLVTCLVATLCGFGGATASFFVFRDSFAGPAGEHGPTGPSGLTGEAGPPGPSGGVDGSDFDLLVSTVRANNGTLLDHGREIDAIAADVVDLQRPDRIDPLASRCTRTVQAVTRVSVVQLTGQLATHTALVCAW